MKFSANIKTYVNLNNKLW